MPYKRDPIAEKLDVAAGAFSDVTGLSRLQQRLKAGRTVRFRFIPLGLIGIAIVGLWVQAARSELFGYLVILVAWMVGSAIQAFSPAGNARGAKLDEREAALVRSGHFAGLLAALGIAVLGCLTFGMASIANVLRLGAFWTPESGTDWFALTFFLLAVESNVAAIAASAKLPADLPDEDE